MHVVGWLILQRVCGSSYLGDIKKLGITPKQYRTAKLLLERIGFSTFLGTNKGTTATLVSIDVYDINAETKGEQEDKPQDKQRANEGTNKGRQTKNEKKEEEREELKKKDIVDFLDVFNFFKSTTGKQVQTKSTASLIRRSNKYKSINARLQEGATVEQCKQIIKLKYNEWKDDAKMKRYIRFETIFNKTKFESYLDELGDSKSGAQEMKFTYEVPEFDSAEARQMYFLARYNNYKMSGTLDEYKVNTEYRQRAIYKHDAESLCFELELQYPKLLDLEFNYTAL